MLELEIEHLGLELKVEPGALEPKRWDPEARPESKLAVLWRDPEPEPDPDDPGLSLPGLWKPTRKLLKEMNFKERGGGEENDKRNFLLHFALP